MKSALPPLVDNDSEILILGTMPGERSIALQQYYGNRGNLFWKILFAIYGENFSHDYDAKKALLKKHRIALWNVLASCDREGSQDNNIKNERANNFTTFFKTHINIKRVYFESKAAAKYYEKLAVEPRDINFQILPSTSGLNAGMSYEEKLALWKGILVTDTQITFPNNLRVKSPKSELDTTKQCNNQRK